MYYNLIFLNYKSSFLVNTVAMLYLKDEHYIVVKCYFILPKGIKFWCCWFFKQKMLCNCLYICLQFAHTWEFFSKYVLFRNNILIYDFFTHVKIITFVFLSVENSFYISWTVFFFNFRFPQHLQSGLLELISPPAEFYPDFNNIKQTYGDTKERVK